LIKQAKTPNVAIETVLVEGKAFRKIVEIAEERSMDVIVLNMQSKNRVERALLGATAERVVRFARCPVLSIPVAGHKP
jgi:nucleotide-binding universal stress UspA family protein